MAQELTTVKRTAAEAVEVAKQRASLLERKLEDAMTPPPAPTRAEFDERFRRLSQRLGRRRDGSGLHVALATAAATIGTGDLARAVEVLRSAEGEA